MKNKKNYIFTFYKQDLWEKECTDSRRLTIYVTYDDPNIWPWSKGTTKNWL